MLTEIADHLRAVGPFFAVIWAVTILSVLLRPQRYLNSFLLMAALAVSMLFFAGFFGDEGASWFLLACFLLVMLALFLVPVLLIWNGIVMLRRESFSLAHVLSLALGILVGVGELAYVLGFYGSFGRETVSYWVLLLVFTVFYFSFLMLSFVLYSVFIQIMPHRMAFDYVIVHGCGLAEGERMTKLLSKRVDKAIEIYRKCRKKPKIIPSGGQGGDEKISEARAMGDYLLARGIPEESILLEDRSATTRENLLNSKAIIDERGGGKRIALVSSNYHIYRCLRLARSLGLKCIGIGADVALYYWPSALIREFLAVFLTRRFLLWSALGYLIFVGPVIYLLIWG